LRLSFLGNKKTDVVVIGGGISGLTAATRLSQGGKNVVLLESRTVGEGTTGNSTGNLYVTVDEHLSSIRKKWGDQVMKNVVASRTSAMNLIRSTALKFGLQCDFTEVSFNLLLEDQDGDQEELFKKELEAFRLAGLSPVVTNNVSVPFKSLICLSIPGQAQFNPLKYAKLLAKALTPGVSIHERSPVIEIDHHKGIVRTPGGQVEADHIIMATHTPKGVWMVQTALGSYREHAVAYDVRSGGCPPGIYWSVGKVKHSVRSYAAGGKNYVMVIGDKYKTGHAHDTNSYVRGLNKYLQDRFSLGTEGYTWGGQHYRAADGLPYIGKHSDKLWFLTGFATDGLVYGVLGACIISDEILGRGSEWHDTYKLKRFTPVKSFREFFKENIDNFAQYLKDAPWTVEAHETADIRPGEGKVMEIKGEKVAVYRDESGALHPVSAICTHMKCSVHFNAAERTWDCPCHGSRFDIAGRVIEGPAVIDLPAKPIDEKKQNP
jgi:glycine/D-amino acid oxidase-like deaminating enzyme/nitrite reductase/ring-hydroxylating ferredoxin subunit